ncbi:putative sugar nucleotidyl transferase [Rhodothermus profundi]|uniref:UDP-N-acetylglucosamine diphosphorylase/glucosamine-1-phosphate N-acetyltransferase n=1 Tax=Rhodothermus profundi TaxID=633813 RepID=A0A1M6THL4_9BACT|nr:putative sugar nucleotidyl transferase [Rhodothermus profundi]SHK56467.1 UDP-N-acetylglucosamine diphosphorylase/glucosamine-1-phosphate N-acetyltransferase [Rhodothermus profundi]
MSWTLCVFEDQEAAHLAPLVHTRPVYDLRLGLPTLLERVLGALQPPAVCLHARAMVAPMAARLYQLPVNPAQVAGGVLLWNGRALGDPGEVLARIRRAATDGESARRFVQGETVVAAWFPKGLSRPLPATLLSGDFFADLPEERVEGVRLVGRLWHLIDWMEQAFATDGATWDRPTAADSQALVQPGAVLVGREQIRLAPGATVRAGAILNATDGPIYVGPGAVVSEGAVLVGPVAVGERAEVRVGAQLRNCVVGPGVKLGGEVHTTIVHSYSNKAHDGFLGHAYIGRWCNLGAGTTCSNLRNDYGPVTLYNETLGTFEATGRQFLGLFMGDHTKTSIGTTFNTGTVVGVSCNLYGPGFHARYVPSFSWGSPAEGYVPFRLEKALRVAEAVMARRQHTLDEAERAVLTALFEQVHATSSE